jgi:hypothetical protein
MKNFLQFFQYGHLPPKLQEVARPFAVLAVHCVETAPKNPESAVGMRYLMQAKDCFIRAAIFKSEG